MNDRERAEVIAAAEAGIDYLERIDTLVSGARTQFERVLKDREFRNSDGPPRHVNGS